ncbi:sugar ABC transporter ATP-binding protein [Acetanaerobacterium elongatum]|uniref:Simple sugar transport system ATP-binding protein n=1 Tax=Acetanaerobacterium elongatum TaxID=258515 RepID=A0A1H0H156_9FIRM|nr:sugar ABC transporter ATP-binding protein [Acetanaerobacterium elongatum]SDO12887.1 simple sugar transport system ATP-binding protein [Acetanaerobacterium elongatum]
MSKIIMEDISVEFPGVKALQHVDCDFEGGRVKALVGANGAGKSTLMKVLSGVNAQYTGQIELDGVPVEIRSPSDAKRLGIEIVYQEVDTALVPNLSVGENVMMEYLVYGLGKGGVIDWNHLHTEAAKTLENLHVSLDTKQLVSALSLAQKQIVVIARAMLGHCKFLILDEPTAPLSVEETKNLFELVRRLRDKGIGVIFISHRLNELFEICDSITVLRDGQLIKTFELDEKTTIPDIVELMLGRVYNEAIDKSGRAIGGVLLNIKNLADNENRVQDICLNVRSGEIVGLSGLVGAGKTELCKTLFGAFGRQQGTILINDKKVRADTPAAAVKAGMAFIPEERRKEGIVVGESVMENLSLATLKNHARILSLLNHKSESRAADTKVADLKIKTPSIRQRVGLLSGGNQQKVTIGKWLDSGAEIYIFDEPTKGIDVGAKAEVYKLIVDLARKGKGIIYASSEQAEIMSLTDRVYVMYSGRIQKELVTADTNEAELLFYSTGGKNDAEQN